MAAFEAGDTRRPLSGYWLKRRDAEILADALVPVAGCAPLLRGGAYPSGSAPYFHSCKHWDAETGDCRIYNERPDLCRDYPYGSECVDAECAMPQEPPLTFADFEMVSDVVNVVPGETPCFTARILTE